MLRGLLRVEVREGKGDEGDSMMIMMPEDVRRVLVKRWEEIRDMIIGSYESTGCAPFGGRVPSTERVGEEPGLITAEYESTN